MATLRTIYKGNLRTEVVHVQSGNRLITDAPTDNNGKGEYFSPTDILAAALGSCMLTIIGIYAQNKDIDITGTEIDTEKVMYSDPRRVGEIHITITFPRPLEEKYQKIFQRIALTCPVYNSLHPDIKKEIIYKFK